MKYRLVITNNGRQEVKSFDDSKELINFLVRFGVKHTGENQNDRQRPELQGHPTFDRVIGPMWDGDAVRYEDQAAYDQLST